MVIERATEPDWPQVRDLLTASGLPLDGAQDAFGAGVVVRDGDNVVGCAAIEPYGRAALLRSVAVAADRRGTGVGKALVAAAEDLARGRGADDLYLLTETAATWFDHLGYTEIERTTAPGDLGRSVEFETACSASAVAMRRSLR